MSRIDTAEAFAAMWRRSRELAGRSQEYMAKSLGVSKKTVQNWEDGTSCPSQAVGFEWFQVLGLQPMPFYLNILYPQLFTNLIHSNDDDLIEEALTKIIKDLPTSSKKELLFLLCGDHGSSVIGMLEMITAHLQSPLRDRVSVAQSICTNYEIASASGKIRQPQHQQPNMYVLSDSMARAKKAVIDGKETYTTMI